MATIDKNLIIGRLGRLEIKGIKTLNENLIQISKLDSQKAKDKIQKVYLNRYK